MCGITGLIYSSSPKNNIRDEITNFNNALYHRGPDYGDIYMSKCGNIALGHRRLSILDLSSHANQPLMSDDKRWVITFNGEIYNHKELRNKLVSLGYTFHTHSDTEVILHAYRQWGDKCLLKFNGMWAFAIYDALKGEMFIARDRFGVKPLYYVEDSTQGLFAFASEQKAFKELDLFELSLNASAVSASISNYATFESTQASIYTGVKKLLPGECIFINSSSHKRVHRWWNFIEELSRFDCSESFASVFSNACKLRATADVDIAFSLSGGIDSSAVLSYAHDYVDSSKRKKAFIGSFSVPEFDEFPLAMETVKKQKIGFHQVTISEEQLIEELVNCSWQMEDITSRPVIAPWLIYKNMKQSGFKVSLEGHGGDEIFAGYFNHIQAHLGDLINERKSLDEIASTISLITEMTSVSGMGNASLPSLIRGATASDFSMKNSHPLSRYLTDFDARDYPQSLLMNKDSDRSLLFVNLYNDFTSNTLPSILRNFDKCSMGHSVEVRSPFLDWRVVLKAFSMPASAKVHLGKSKYHLRTQLDRLPQKTVESKVKLGFDLPYQSWLSGKFKNVMFDMVNSQSFLQSSLYDGVRVKKDFETFYAQNNWKMIAEFWKIFNLYILQSELRK